MSFDILMALSTGALLAGFVSGFAGFGTALFASGIWFAFLPTEIVPPLVTITAVVGQLTGLARLSKQLEFRKAVPMIGGGILGVPLGTLILLFIAPGAIKAFIGLFLVTYALWQLMGKRMSLTIPAQPVSRDRIVGFGGGILGGLAGLSGPAPIVWLQLQNLPSAEQRARYQPFNLVILCCSALSMAAFGVVTTEVLVYAAIAAPVCVFGAFIGVKAYAKASEQAFRKWIIWLLLVSGLFILAQVLL